MSSGFTMLDSPQMQGVPLARAYPPLAKLARHKRTLLCPTALSDGASKHPSCVKSGLMMGQVDTTCTTQVRLTACRPAPGPPQSKRWPLAPTLMNTRGQHHSLASNCAQQCFVPRNKPSLGPQQQVMDQCVGWQPPQLADPGDFRGWATQFVVGTVQLLHCPPGDSYYTIILLMITRAHTAAHRPVTLPGGAAGLAVAPGRADSQQTHQPPTH
jgi:hypothetical protein